jgi:hypothetical protein
VGCNKEEILEPMKEFRTNVYDSDANVKISEWEKYHRIKVADLEKEDYDYGDGYIERVS